jgi:DNA polymerase III subunit delta'
MKKRIVGNEKTIEKLKKAVKSGELSHAYIFEGPEGIGKKTLALEFAKMILCHSADIPCEKCQSCLKLKTENHPDLFLESPVKKKSTSKSTYSVSDIEKMQSEMRRKPNESKKKVFIITEGEKLSVDSQNKFLKTLEEPLDNIVTIILVNNANKLLKTTTSRCQTVKLEAIPDRDIENYIIEEYGEIQKLDSVLSFARGNIGKTIELLKDEKFQDRRIKVIDIISDIIEKDITKVFSGLKFFEEEKEYVSELLDIMTSWFRDLLLYEKTKTEEFLINKDRFRMLNYQSQMLSTIQIYDIVKRIGQTRLDLEHNVNYQLTIELLLLTIYEHSNNSKQNTVGV